VADLKKLHDLGLDDNDVTFPPAAIFDAGLESVRNYLNRLHSAPTARAVDFSGVSMATFSCHPYMASFTLTKVSLRQCGLRSLKPDISRLSVLQELDVSHNLLRELPASVGELTALRHLYADHNEMKNLEPALGLCLSLKTLSVANNQLTVLTPSLGFATNLKTLTVTGNAIKSPPDVYLRKRSVPWVLQVPRMSPTKEADTSKRVLLKKPTNCKRALLKKLTTSKRALLKKPTTCKRALVKCPLLTRR